jgi:AraC-like DNA-binding protein
VTQKRGGLDWSEQAVSSLLAGGSKELASRSGVSVRTLRRHFNRDGLTLRGVVCAKRAAVILNLMQAGMPLAGIARRVGLSGSPALARFVRREFGTTPKVLAADLAPGSASGH